jgi:hypothetical protein
LLSFDIRFFASSVFVSNLVAHNRTLPSSLEPVNLIGGDALAFDPFGEATYIFDSFTSFFPIPLAKHRAMKKSERSGKLAVPDPPPILPLRTTPPHVPRIGDARITPRPTVRNVVSSHSVAGEEAVVPALAPEEVVPDPAAKNVVSDPAAEDVVSGAAEDAIVSGTAAEDVVSPAAENHVIPPEAAYDVASGGADEAVVAGRADYGACVRVRVGRLGLGLEGADVGAVPAFGGGARKVEGTALAALVGGESRLSFVEGGASGFEGVGSGRASVVGEAFEAGGAVSDYLIPGFVECVVFASGGVAASDEIVAVREEGVRVFAGVHVGAFVFGDDRGRDLRAGEVVPEARHARTFGGASLFVMVEFSMTARPFSLRMPPPDPAVFPEIVEFLMVDTVRGSSISETSSVVENMPPPRPSVDLFPDSVDASTISAPKSLWMAPPSLSAVLPVKEDFFTVRSPILLTPPPMVAEVFPVTRTFVSVIPIQFIDVPMPR